MPFSMKSALLLRLFLIVNATCLLLTTLNATAPVVTGLQFLENKGQIKDQNRQPNSSVKFLFRSPGFNVQLRQTGFSYDTYTASENNVLQFQRVDIELSGCNSNALITCEGRSDACFNFLNSTEPEGGTRNVHSYSKVR